MRKIIFVLFQSIFCLYLHAQEKFTLTDDGIKLFTKVSGKGPVCIFIHGGPGAWSKSFEVLGGNKLENTFRMVYYDQRGSGRSDTAADYSLDRSIKDIENIRVSLQTEKVFILSHSFGGIVAFNYAKYYPEHVSGMILVNSTLDIYNSIEQQIIYMASVTGQHIPAHTNDSIMNVYGQIKNKFSKNGLEYSLLSKNKESVDKVDSVDNTFSRNRAFAQNVWGYPAYFKDFTKESSQVKIPVLIITGATDYAIGVEHYKLFHFPNQKTVSINGGHLLYYEKNPAFVNAVNSFVEHIKKSN